LRSRGSAPHGRFCGQARWQIPGDQLGRCRGYGGPAGARLAALGIEPGDRVALVSENRPEWVVADLAIMSAGAVTVPAYVTNTVEDHRHILAIAGRGRRSCRPRRWPLA